MKFTATDLKRLRWSLLLLVVAIAAGAAAGWGGYSLLAKAKAAKKIAVAESAERKGALARAAQEEQELREKIQRFHLLKQRGYIGDENRLDWLEQLSRIAKARRLIDLEYEFLPQKPVDALLLPAGAAAGSYSFLGSGQRFTVKLLHEGELIGFLRDLRKAQALVVVRGCDITRIPAGSERRLLDPQLNAECRLDWITAERITAEKNP